MDNNLNNIYAEVWEICKYIDVGFVSKIPSTVLKEIRENKNNNWTFKYDLSISLENQNIMEDTKKFLSILYYKYYCDDNEKKEVLNCWIKNNKNKKV